MMLDEAKILSELPLHSIKFHQLILVKNTPIIKDWKENPEDFVFMKFDEYKEFMIDFLEKLSPHIVIERFAGEVPPRFQEGGSNWELLRNETLVQKIEQRMIERNTYQGRLFK
jgi:radical SAM superfamily enzyme